MAIGNNQGGNLNVLVFEVGMLITDPNTQQRRTVTIAVHPLHVAPSSIDWQDRTRSKVDKTAGGAVRTVGGRNLRTCNLQGVWGVEARGFGPLVGSGEYRAQRFYHEVVRLGDALYQEDVDAALEAVNASPLVREALRGFTPDNALFYINFYNFWDGIKMECQIPSYTWSRRARGGGAVGLIHYSLQVQEVGPVVGGGLGEEIIDALFHAFTVWDDLNDTIETYTLDELEEGLTSIPGPFVSELSDSLEAVQAQLETATALMGANPSATPGDGMEAFMAQCERLTDAAEDIEDVLSRRATGVIAAEDGAINWAGQHDEGVIDGLWYYDQQNELLDLSDAAQWQISAGKLFGMSAEAYQAYVTSAGSSARRKPNVAGTVPHYVTMLDTEKSLVDEYGVDFDEILRVNNLTPDEALVPGTELQIPTVRSPGPTPIDGLPTFGSHRGKSALGVDLDVSLTPDEDGKPILVTEGACVAQGLELLLGDFGEQVMEDANALLEVVRGDYLEERLRRLFLSDRRIQSVDNVAVAEVSAGYDLDVACTAINGTAVRTGGTE